MKEIFRSYRAPRRPSRTNTRTDAVRPTKENDFESSQGPASRGCGFRRDAQAVRFQAPRAEARSRGRVEGRGGQGHRHEAHLVRAGDHQGDQGREPAGETDQPGRWPQDRHQLWYPEEEHRCIHGVARCLQIPQGLWSGVRVRRGGLLPGCGQQGGDPGCEDRSVF